MPPTPFENPNRCRDSLPSAETRYPAGSRVRIERSGNGLDSVAVGGNDAHPAAPCSTSNAIGEIAEGVSDSIQHELLWCARDGTESSLRRCLLRRLDSLSM